MISCYSWRKTFSYSSKIHQQNDVVNSTNIPTFKSLATVNKPNKPYEAITEPFIYFSIVSFTVRK